MLLAKTRVHHERYMRTTWLPDKPTVNCLQVVDLRDLALALDRPEELLVIIRAARLIAIIAALAIALAALALQE